eukprot:1908309-Rhodomonas_salina.1
MSGTHIAAFAPSQTGVPCQNGFQHWSSPHPPRCPLNPLFSTFASPSPVLDRCSCYTLQLLDTHTHTPLISRSAFLNDPISFVSADDLFPDFLPVSAPQTLIASGIAKVEATLVPVSAEEYDRARLSDPNVCRSLHHPKP